MRLSDVLIVPLPASVTTSDGSYTITSGTKLNIQKGLENEAEYFSKFVEKRLGYKLQLTETESATKGIVLKLNAENKELGAEGYQLIVDKKGVHIEAATAAGVFYGIQSLKQLFASRAYIQLKSGVTRSQPIPYCEVNDEPRFAYRGMHLDVGRHFQSTAFVKKYIDFLADHKLNKFHWHLTEDQGWRIEIEKYPKLTTVSSIRSQTQIRKTEDFDGVQHGGFYSKDDIKEVVAYAKARHVTIIPEIEMPGHSVAALAAYPELSCTGGPFVVRTKWGVSEDVYCAGKEATFEFIENVLTEVLELFPSEYIHIGGDEAPKKRWNECPDCKKRIQTEGLANADELQSYFIKRVEAFLNGKGRKLIGWDEIMEGGLSPNATVMSWRGTKGGIEAAKQGHNAIMTPWSHLYFDGYQGHQDIEPYAIGYWAPMEKVYGYEPIPSELTAEEAKFIMGAQANVWTEFIDSPEHIEYMALPRMSALSEVVWSPIEKRNFEDFESRMRPMYERWTATYVNFRIPEVVAPRVIVLNDSVAFELGSKMDIGQVRYAFGQQDIEDEYMVYNTPLIFRRNTQLTAALFLPGGRLGPITKHEILLASKAKRNKEYGLEYSLFKGPFPKDYVKYFNETEPDETGRAFLPDPKMVTTEMGNFGIRFSGLIFMPNQSQYEFYIDTNNPCSIFIDDKELFSTDKRLLKTKKVKEDIDSGYHKFEVYITNWWSAPELSIRFSGPGMEEQTIPASMLYTVKK